METPYEFHLATGDIIFALNNKLHREDGPAMIMAEHNLKRWFLHDVEYKFEDYIIAAGWSDDQIVEYKLKIVDIIRLMPYNNYIN